VRWLHWKASFASLRPHLETKPHHEHQKVQILPPEYPAARRLYIRILNPFCWLCTADACISCSLHFVSRPLRMDDVERHCNAEQGPSGMVASSQDRVQETFGSLWLYEWWLILFKHICSVTSTLRKRALSRLREGVCRGRAVPSYACAFVPRVSGSDRTLPHDLWILASRKMKCTSHPSLPEPKPKM
jgi:hypothetical protein